MHRTATFPLRPHSPVPAAAVASSPWTVRRLRTAAVGMLALFLSLGLLPATPAIASSVTIAGSVFDDLDRDGARDGDEPPFIDVQVTVLDRAGTAVATTRTDSAGWFQFTGLPGGKYWVGIDYLSWVHLRDSFVPTTTGTEHPWQDLEAWGDATVDLGLRSILWSHDVRKPIDQFVGPSGLRVQTYNDVFPARFIHDELAAGLVGDEAPYVTVRFAYGSSNYTSAGVTQNTSGTFSDYRAVAYVTYRSWLMNRDLVLSHEYGHAWSLYYAYIVHQDASMRAYLEARGLADDPRVGSSYEWDVRELIAEDYRQLLGPPSARQHPQMNREIPSASDVPELERFLAEDFVAVPPSLEPDPEPEPSAEPAPEPSVPDEGDEGTSTVTEIAGNLNGRRTVGSHVVHTGGGAASLRVGLDRSETLSVRVLASDGSVLASAVAVGAVELTFEATAGELTVEVEAARGKYTGQLTHYTAADGPEGSEAVEDDGGSNGQGGGRGPSR